MQSWRTRKSPADSRPAWILNYVGFWNRNPVVVRIVVHGRVRIEERQVVNDPASSVGSAGEVAAAGTGRDFYFVKTAGDFKFDFGSIDGLAHFRDRGAGVHVFLLKGVFCWQIQK